MDRCCTPLSKVDMVLFVLGFWHALTFKVILNISWELWTMFHAASQCRECGSHKTQTVPCYTFATLGSEQKSEKGPLLPRGLICPSLPYMYPNVWLLHKPYSDIRGTLCIPRGTCIGYPYDTPDCLNSMSTHVKCFLEKCSSLVRCLLTSRWWRKQSHSGQLCISMGPKEFINSLLTYMYMYSYHPSGTGA